MSDPCIRSVKKIRIGGLLAFILEGQGGKNSRVLFFCVLETKWALCQAYRRDRGQLKRKSMCCVVFCMTRVYLRFNVSKGPDRY